ncbi:MAG: Gfo/Idh/MocA family oxidoreductase [Candidatus Hydrogenedentes bacterium]|nr:Gfo/Idh/MocA family oxidoreductase [Candidatus Hydrogenedentota bacterium]
MSHRIRVGFIGAGGIAVVHFKRTNEIKEAEVSAITEPSRNSLKSFYERCPEAKGLPVYEDYKDMIKKEALDAVYVLSPHAYHFEQIMYSLDAGLHVLTEKPMVCSISHAKKVISKSEKVGKVLMISYQRHFEPAFRYMREQIQRGSIGEVQFVQALLSQEWLRLTKNTWRQDPKLSCGGQLNDSGSHFIDIMMWMTGLKVKEVFAKIEFFDSKVDINSALTLVFEGGAIGNLSVIGNAPGWYEDHTIVGSKGALFLRQGLGVLHQNENGRYLKVKLPKSKSDPNSNFIRSILGKEKPEVPPECGLRVIEVTESAWRSAKLGKPVKVY